jgi:CysZ protein
MSVFAEITNGFRAYPRGVAWLKSHPGHLAVLFLPLVLGIVAFVTCFGLLFSYDDQLVAMMLPAKPDSWWAVGLYYIGWFFLDATLVVFGAILALGITSIIAAPIYDFVSQAVERELTGKVVQTVGWTQFLSALVSEFKKILFIFCLTIILLFIPVLNVISIAIAALLLGWDFFDYPLSRRGWPLKQRLRLVRREGWRILGFGVWLVIPFVQVLFMPLAVVGGTMLALEALERDGVNS